MTVVSLIPNNALCVSQEELAVRLERCATQVRSGEFAELERVVVLYDTGSDVFPQTYGRQCNTAELVGILEYAKQKVMT